MPTALYSSRKKYFFTGRRRIEGKYVQKDGAVKAFQFIIIQPLRRIALIFFKRIPRPQRLESSECFQLFWSPFRRNQNINDEKCLREGSQKIETERRSRFIKEISENRRKGSNLIKSFTLGKITFEQITRGSSQNRELRIVCYTKMSLLFYKIFLGLRLVAVAKIELPYLLD